MQPDQVILIPSEYAMADGTLTEHGVQMMTERLNWWMENAFKCGVVDKAEIANGIKDLYELEGCAMPRLYVCQSPLVLVVSSLLMMVFYDSWQVGNKKDAITRVVEGLAALASFELTGEVHAAVYAVVPPEVQSFVAAKSVDELQATPGFATFKNATATVAHISVTLGEYMHGGNLWPALPAFYTGCRDYLKLDWPCFGKPLTVWEHLAKHSAYRWIHEEFCIVSSFPKTLKFKDAEGLRSHCEDGPSHEWYDGFKLWHIDGHRVNEQIVLRPSTITPDQIHAESNGDVRACMLARKGWLEYVKEAQLEKLDVFRNEVEDTLEILFKAPFDATILLTECPSNAQIYAIPGIPGLTTCEAFRRWYHRADERPINIIGRT